MTAAELGHLEPVLTAPLWLADALADIAILLAVGAGMKKPPSRADFLADWGLHARAKGLREIEAKANKKRSEAAIINLIRSGAAKVTIKPKE